MNESGPPAAGQTRYLPFAGEGWAFVLPAVALAVGGWAWLGPWLGAPLTLLAAFCVFFYRDPERIPPPGDLVIVSPADGKIVSIEVVEHPSFPGGRALRIGIFLSVFNVHVNRSPLAGRVLAVRHQPGKFLNALDPASSGENEHNVIALETRVGYMEVKQIAGIIARRIVCRPQPGDWLERGQRFGMIRFGSRTEVYLPAETVPWAKIGDRARGGATPLGRLDGIAKPS